MGLLSRLSAGNVDTSPLSDFWFRPLGAMSKTGVNVSADSAMDISAVHQGVRLMSQIVGMLPKFVFRRLDGGGKEKNTEHDLHKTLRQTPNRWQTAMQFFSQMQGLCMLHGDAYAEIVPGPRTGFRDELIPLNPTKIHVEQLATGRLRYIFIRDDGTRRTLNQDQVFHVPGFGTNGITGYSLVQKFKETAGLALATEQYGANFFGQSAIPPVALKSKGRVGNKQAVADSWNAAYGGLDGSHKTAILEEGMDISLLDRDNEKSQFLELRKFIVTEFSRWLNISPHMLSDLERAHFSNVEQMGLSLVIYQTMPHVVSFEQAIYRDLLTEQEQETLFVDFSVDGLVRGDIKTRHEAYKVAVENGWMTRNEVRERENMNPLEGLDEPLQQLNMATVGRDGKGDSSARAGGSLLHGQALAITRAAASRVISKEKAQLKKWAEKKASDSAGWEKTVKAFYAKHAEFVSDVLSVSSDAADDYCARQRDAVLTRGMAVVASWGDAKELEVMSWALSMGQNEVIK